MARGVSIGDAFIRLFMDLGPFQASARNLSKLNLNILKGFKNFAKEINRMAAASGKAFTVPKGSISDLAKQMRTLEAYSRTFGRKFTRNLIQESVAKKNLQDIGKILKIPLPRTAIDSSKLRTALVAGIANATRGIKPISLKPLVSTRMPGMFPTPAEIRNQARAFTASVAAAAGKLRLAPISFAKLKPIQSQMRAITEITKAQSRELAIRRNAAVKNEALLARQLSRIRISEIKAPAIKAPEVVAPKFDAAAQGFASLIRGTRQSMRGFIANLALTGSKIGTGVGALLVFVDVVKIAMGFVGKLAGILVGVLGKAFSIVAGIVEGVAGVITSVLGGAFKFVGGVIQKFIGGLARLPTNLLFLSIALDAVAISITAPFKIGIDAAADFSEAMAKVSTQLVHTGVDISEFSDGVKKLSVRFGESTEDIANGLFEILSSTIPANQAMGLLEQGLKTAKAGMTDTRTAVGTLITFLEAYQLRVSEAADISDFLFTIILRGRDTFEAWSRNIGKVAATAALAGISLEELGGLLSTVSRVFGRADLTITSVNTVISAFLKTASPKVLKVAKELGVEWGRGAITGGRLRDTIEKLNKGTAEQIRILFRDERGFRGFAVALRDSTGVAEDTKAQFDRTGATVRALGERMKSLRTIIEQIEQAFHLLKIEVGEAVAPVIKALLNPIVELTDSLGKVVKENSKTIQSFFKFALALSGIAAAVTIISTAVFALSALMATLPIAAITVAIGFLAFKLLKLAGAFEAIERIAGISFDKIGKAFKKTVDSIIVNGRTLPQFLREVWLNALQFSFPIITRLQDEAIAIWFKIRIKAVEALNFIVNNLDTFFTKMEPIWHRFRDLAIGVWDEIEIRVGHFLRKLAPIMKLVARVAVPFGFQIDLTGMESAIKAFDPKSLLKEQSEVEKEIERRRFKRNEAFLEKFGAPPSAAFEITKFPELDERIEQRRVALQKLIDSLRSDTLDKQIDAFKRLVPLYVKLQKDREALTKEIGIGQARRAFFAFFEDMGARIKLLWNTFTDQAFIAGRKISKISPALGAIAGAVVQAPIPVISSIRNALDILKPGATAGFFEGLLGKKPEVAPALAGAGMAGMAVGTFSNLAELMVGTSPVNMALTEAIKQTDYLKQIAEDTDELPAIRENLEKQESSGIIFGE